MVSALRAVLLLPVVLSWLAPVSSYAPLLSGRCTLPSTTAYRLSTGTRAAPRPSPLWSTVSAGDDPAEEAKKGRWGPLSKTREWASKVTGPAGLTSYGVLNAVYYTLAVSLAWVATGGGQSVAGAAPAKATLKDVAKRFAKVFVIAYAGSQVTKAPRLAGAVVLAPTMDRLLDQIQGRLRLASKWQAVGLMVALLVGSTLAIFGGLLLQGFLGLHGTGPARYLSLVPAGLVSLALGAALLTARRQTPPSSSAADAEVIETAAPPPAAAKPRSGKKKSKLPPPPPNPNVHGWDQSPAYLRGKWKLTSINKTAEGYDDLLDIIQEGIRNVIFRRDAAMKLTEGRGNLTCLGWEFTPANRRIVAEVLVPEKDVVLRFSGEVRRRPKYWTRAQGFLRVRPARDGVRQSHRAIPSTDSRWPKIAEFTLEKDIDPPKPKSKFEQLVLWARLEAPRFKNTKAGRKAQAYMQDSLEGKTDWNAQALKFQLWRYFDGPKPAKAKGGKREEEE